MPNKVKALCKGFAPRLHGAIAAAGLKQKFIAAELGYTSHAVNAWCHGKNEPDLSTVVELAGLLHVSCDFLLSGNSNELTHSRLDDVIARLTRCEKELF